MVLISPGIQVKRGMFSEHSPILYDISGVAEWNKVNSGLVKMYHAEVRFSLSEIIAMCS
jgi:hypothetical protein